jgi:hypothetical protein
MKQKVLLLFVCTLVVMGMVSRPVSAQDSQGSPAGLKAYTVVKPALGLTQEQIEAEVTANASANLQVFTYHVKSSRDGANYTGTMVGKDPFGTAPASASIPTEVIPLIIKMTGPGGVGIAKFDPTVADNNCMKAPNNVPLTVFQGSPIIKTHAFTMNGVNVGTAQYVDAFQRANFWFEVVEDKNNFHTILSPVKTLTAIIVNVPAASGLAYATGPFGGCTNGIIGVMDINWFDAYVSGTIIPALKSQGVNPSTFPIFLLYNVVMSVGTPDIFGQCCILGYHGANGMQTYSPMDFDTTKVFGSSAQDISIATHEVGEWAADPFGNNATPAWGHIGQVSGCQGNLEVGDPLTGTQFPPVTMPNGFIYHPQELAFFSWFYGGPSIGAGKKFSNKGTFATDAGAVCH